MSKIGRKLITLASTKVEIKDQEIHYTGKKSSGVYHLPKELIAQVQDNCIAIVPSQEGKDSLRLRDLNCVWGLHRSLLANAIKGSQEEFEKKIKIVGLGYKAAVSGKTVTFSLGYSHKKVFELPNIVSLDIDKSGQLLTLRSTDKMLIGQICSNIKKLRATEPYKGTGVQLTTDVIARKSGKAKSS